LAPQSPIFDSLSTRTSTSTIAAEQYLPWNTHFVQGAEFEAAQADRYTIREHFDFPRAVSVVARTG
jgi:hypothetical protein